AARHAIDIGYRPGQLSVAHRERLLPEYKRHVEIMAEQFDYPHLAYMDREETAFRLGSSFYHGGVRDTGTGHIHPLRLLIGLGRVAQAAGARIHEQTRADAITSSAAGVVVR